MHDEKECIKEQNKIKQNYNFTKTSKIVEKMKIHTSQLWLIFFGIFLIQCSFFLMTILIIVNILQIHTNILVYFQQSKLLFRYVTNNSIPQNKLFGEFFVN